MAWRIALTGRILRLVLPRPTVKGNGSVISVGFVRIRGKSLTSMGRGERGGTRKGTQKTGRQPRL
jgi:hypothetical protein